MTELSVFKRLVNRFTPIYCPRTGRTHQFIDAPNGRTLCDQCGEVLVSYPTMDGMGYKHDPDVDRTDTTQQEQLEKELMDRYVAGDIRTVDELERELETEIE